ncbi:hypothetical protein F5Y03DRAFT_409122 [Xylaria venustula]|nr:hypothetical protein F5Y03DRAFT_409122 [Xylaria venustula]
MYESKLNYFTYTIGEAAVLKEQEKLARSFQTVLQLVECQAKDNPNSPALGFTNPQEKPHRKEPDFVTFADLDEFSRIAASELKKTLPENSHNSSTVGLFCYSSLDLVLSWLGLLRLGRKAFFFATLCQAAGIKVIVVDESHEGVLSQIRGDIHIIRVPSFYGKRESIPDVITLRTDTEPMSSTAFFQHTSGTSSGLPKPISQTEWGAVGCLPVFSDPNPKATFTTTPLYHGGLADALRAWTSGAMIWFFPEDIMPVTGDNVVPALNAARRRSQEVRVKYFSSVPYVLQMLAEVEGCAGIELLRSMDLVGVGGAPLSPAIGDHLVESGIKLLSRMGSAECGFLMPSHREYDKDSNWQYLRAVSGHTSLVFEPREDGLSELVVKSSWPLLLKTNREDGSYATADLFEPHPLIHNAWRYHGRADALIILANGKKVDPSPIEDELRSCNKMTQDVLVFGTGRDYPGAILFTRFTNLSDNDYLGAVWSDIERSNSQSSQHSRLSPLSLAVVRIDEGEEPLPKSSKGTVLRRQAESRYAKLINQVYATPRAVSTKIDVLDDELVQYICEIFRDVLGRRVNPEEDIYSQGVDSIACIRITKQIQATLNPSLADVLPQNLLYNNGTIIALANTLRQIRQGRSLSGHDDEEQYELMRRLVKQYSILDDYEDKNSKKKKRSIVVILTGATGRLGAHILNGLIDDCRITKVYCLLRGQSRFAAKERVFKALVKRQLRTEKEMKLSETYENKIFYLPCNLAAPSLDLSEEDRSLLIREATHIIHSAWTVNFNLGLKSFEGQIASTRDLIEMSRASGAEFFFISSTAAVSNTGSAVVPEKVSSEPRDASALGYSRSKWTAEQICASAYTQAAREGSTGSHGKPEVSILRVGQLCGNKFGVWNTNEAYPLLLSTAKITSRLPDLPSESVDWLPVDIAAMAVIEIALPHDNENSPRSMDYPDIPVYHVLNPHRSPSWRQMLDWLSKEPGSTPFEIVPASAWMESLEATMTADQEWKHPCQALVGLWKQRYIDPYLSPKPLVFDVSSTQHTSQSIRNASSLSRQRVIKMWKWLQENC